MGKHFLRLFSEGRPTCKFKKEKTGNRNNVPVYILKVDKNGTFIVDPAAS